MPPKKQPVEPATNAPEPVATTKAKKPVAKKLKPVTPPVSSAVNVTPPPAPPAPPATPAPPAPPAPPATPAAPTPPPSTSAPSSELVAGATTIPPVEDIQLDTLKDFAEFQVRLATIRTNISNLLQDFKQLQKKTERDIKNAQKNSNKRKRKTGVRQPSGFVKPTLISHELADFLNRERGSELARTEVTREINTYIRANKLQDPTNGRKILADEKLKKLLALTSTDELTYFNLQKFMSPHFQKLGQALINGAV